MPTATEPKTTQVRADALKPGMIRVWRGLHSGRIVQQGEIRDVSDIGHRTVQVQYVDINTVSRVRKSVVIEVVAEGFEF